MKGIFILLIFFAGIFSTQAQQPVSFYVQGDADDWQLFMSSKVMTDLNSNGKTVFITLTAGDEGNGNSSFNGSAVAYYMAREKGSIYAAKFASDIVPGSTLNATPAATVAVLNGHNLVKYDYQNTVNYFLRLPDGGTAGNGFAATGNVSLKKFKEGSITSLTSLDNSNTYNGWADLTATIGAIINAEKGTNSQVWLNTGALDATANPNDHSDHIFSSTAAQDAVSGSAWVGINEFINDHSANLSPNLNNGDFENAAAIFGMGVLGLTENKYLGKFTLTNSALLPMDYFSIKRSPAACASPTNLTAGNIANNSVTLSWTAAAGALSYAVEYKLNSATTWTVAAAATTAVTINLVGLTQGSLYDWRLRATCLVGNGSYITAQFTTTVPATCNTPTSLQSLNVNVSSATISWSAVGGAASYDVDYKTAASATWINAATATTATSINLSGLGTTTLYDWRVRANCTAAGLSSAYAGAQFTTIAAPTCNAPAGLASSNVTVSGATVSWSAVTGAANYTLEYKLSSSSNWTVTAAALTATTRNLTGLSNASTYDWRVKSNCTAVGLSSVYTQSQFTTESTPSVPVSFYVQADADDWQLYMSSRVMNDLGNNGKTVFVTLTAGDEGNGANAYGGATVPYYAAREKGSIYGAKFASDILQGNALEAVPSSETVTINGHQLVKYNYRNTVNYFLRLPDGSATGAGYAGTGNVSLKKLKEATIASLTSVDNANTYSWTNLTATIEAIINTEKGTNSQVWLNTGGLDVANNPNDNADHIFASTAAQDAVNALSWVGINEFVNDHSANMTPNLNNSDFQNAAALFGMNDRGLVESRYISKFNASNRAWLPMDYYTVKRTPSACSAPVNLTATAVTTTTATLNWTAAPGAVSYLVEYKLNSASTWTVAQAATITTSANLTSLTAASVYNWRVRSTCSNGSGIYVASQFTTLTPPNCGTPTGLTTTAITATTATANWVAVNGAASYDLDYKMAASPDWISVVTGLTTTSFVGTGLAPSTLYDWRVKANCTAVGLTSAYAQTQFTTPAVPNCAAPTALTSSAIGITTATVSWAAVSGAANYTLEYKLSTATTWTVFAASTALTKNLTALTSGSLYDWRVKSNCTGIGLTSTYATGQFTTIGCFAPNALAVTNIGLTTITLNWAAVNGAANYRVEYKKSTTTTWTTAATAATTTTLNLTGLTHTTLYNWRVRANCTAIGLTSSYTEAQFNTATASCAAPTGLTATAITLNTATLSWSAVNGAAGYILEYKLSTAGTWTVFAASTALSRNMTGLAHSSVYDWRVKSNCTAVGLQSVYTTGQFATVTASCAAPALLATTNITLTSATVNWGAVSGAANYTVEYKLATATTWTTAIASTTSTTRNLTGLANSSVYNWRVRSNCTAVGLTSVYATGQFTTVTASCNTPTALITSNISNSGATVSWTLVSGAANYTVEYKLTSSATWTVMATTTSNSATITGLTGNFQYDWRVKANCTAVGMTSGYAQAQFSTLCSDILEPNETVSAAKAINPDAYYSARIATSTDVDTYKFSNSYAEPNIRVRVTNLPADYDVRLYSNLGSLVATAQTRGTGDETIIYNPSSILFTVGSYKVQVYGYNGANSANCYTIRAELSSQDFTSNNFGRSNLTEEKSITGSNVVGAPKEVQEQKITVLRTGLKVYPVPAASYVNVSFDAFAKGNATIILTNQLGQEVMRKNVGVNDGINITTLNVGHLQQGLYSVRVINGTDIQMQKLLIGR